MSSVYTTTKIAHKTWRISEAGKVNCYLLEGDTSALLIDSCWGVGDLYGIVKSITSKPLAIVATHLHPDHVGGTKQFGNYYVHEADLNFINIRSHTRRSDDPDCAIAPLVPYWDGLCLRNGASRRYGIRRVLRYFRLGAPVQDRLPVGICNYRCCGTVSCLNQTDISAESISSRNGTSGS